MHQARRRARERRDSCQRRLRPRPPAVRKLARTQRAKALVHVVEDAAADAHHNDARPHMQQEGREAHAQRGRRLASTRESHRSAQRTALPAALGIDARAAPADAKRVRTEFTCRAQPVAATPSLSRSGRRHEQRCADERSDRKRDDLSDHVVPFAPARRRATRFAVSSFLSTSASTSVSLTYTVRPGL